MMPGILLNGGARLDYQDLDTAISELEERAGSSAESGRGWKEVWAGIKAISEGFRDVRYPTKADRQNAWDRFQEIVGGVKEAQDRQREQAAESKKSLERRISALRELQQECMNRNASWKAFWSSASELHTDLQGAHLPSKDDKDQLWQELRAIKGEAKDYAATAERERNARNERSTRHRDEIADNIARARPLTDLENMIADIILFIPKITAQIVLSPLGLFEELDERRGELQACSERMREAWNLFESYKHDMRGSDKHEMFQSLRNAQDTLDAAWAQYKQSRSEAREVAAERRAAATARHEAFVERVNANIEKLDERLSRLHGILDHKRDHLRDLQDKLDDARSDSYRSRVEGWIEEEEDAIRSIREQIDQVEGWLEEARQKLR